jgi:hypothetical protein
MTTEKPLFVQQPEVLDRICETIQFGVPFAEAAAAAGIDRRLFNGWKTKGRRLATEIERGRDPKTLTDVERAYVNLYDRTMKARAELIRNNMVKIQVAGSSSWQANAWILERRFPEMFAQASKMKLDAESAARLMDLIVSEVLPFVPEERHAELADRLEVAMEKMDLADSD